MSEPTPFNSEPTVCAVMLTANRPELAKRAVECFRRQTYQNKRLLIWDSSANPPDVDYAGMPEYEYYLIDWNQLVIGQLRNKANTYAGSGEGFIKSDIFIHWDDDDWSHPNRIAEQVALLQSSGADCVGYREMLFWREPRRRVDTEACNNLSCQLVGRHIASGCFVPGEAWLYSNPDPSYALGTSLCYWRRTWEARPFQATNQGEDERFIRGLKCVGISSLPGHETFRGMYKYGTVPSDGKPRMIARIHGANTSTGYSPELMNREANKAGGMWNRAPWNKYCGEVME